MLLIYGFDGLERQAQSFDALRGQAVGFITLTLPFVLYFAISESSRWQASVGKRVLSVVAVGPDSGRLSVGRALARSALKFLPWELGHVFSNHLMEHSVRSPDATPPMWFWVVSIVSMAGALLYAASLFVGDGRTPYDRLARSRVLARS